MRTITLGSRFGWLGRLMRLFRDPDADADSRWGGDRAVLRGDFMRGVDVGYPIRAWTEQAAAARSQASELRARRLLCRMLDMDQKRELQQHGCFTVKVRGRGIFCILPRSTFNVLSLETGAAYCCNIEAFVPISDLMLAQKLLLENDAEHFFTVANRRSEVCAGSWEEELVRSLGRSLR
jgi:hypothetical protein